MITDQEIAKRIIDGRDWPYPIKIRAPIGRVKAMIGSGWTIWRKGNYTLIRPRITGLYTLSDASTGIREARHPIPRKTREIARGE